MRVGFVCKKFPTILSRESGNCVFQNMEEEACRTPSLTKEWGKRSWAPSGRFTSIPLNRKSGQHSSLPRIYSAGNGFAFSKQDLKGASSVLQVLRSSQECKLFSPRYRTDLEGGSCPGGLSSAHWGGVLASFQQYGGLPSFLSEDTMGPRNSGGLAPATQSSFHRQSEQDSSCLTPSHRSKSGEASPWNGMGSGENSSKVGP